METLSRLVILVRDYQEALDFYCGKPGFEKFVDMKVGERRYVHVRLPSQLDVGIWLMQAEGRADRQRIGNQTAGQPVAVFYTNDLQRDYQNLSSRGEQFNVSPVKEGGAVFAHFLDLYENEFVLVELPTVEGGAVPEEVGAVLCGSCLVIAGVFSSRQSVSH